jgi:hypothetical protein
MDKDDLINLIIVGSINVDDYTKEDLQDWSIRNLEEYLNKCNDIELENIEE